MILSSLVPPHHQGDGCNNSPRSPYQNPLSQPLRRYLLRREEGEKPERRQLVFSRLRDHGALGHHFLAKEAIG